MDLNVSIDEVTLQKTAQEYIDKRSTRWIKDKIEIVIEDTIEDFILEKLTPMLESELHAIISDEEFLKELKKRLYDKVTEHIGDFSRKLDIAKKMGLTSVPV